jgi:F5/8 type C domain
VPESSASTPALEPEVSKASPRAPGGGRLRALSLARLRQWLLRSEALAEARQRRLDSGQRSALRAALQSLELADRALDLPEGYRAGTPLAATLMLHQEAVWWALRAASHDPAQPRESLARAAAEHVALLSAVAGGEQPLAALRARFLEPEARSFQALDEGEQLALIARVRPFAGALVASVGAPEERFARVARERWQRPLVALVTTACVALLLAYELVPRDVAAGKAWVASSGYEWGFARSGTTDKFGADDLMFHTGTEQNPWLVVDLGALERVRRVVLENRQTCCQERAIPLIVELSADGINWHKVAYRKEPFNRWEARFRRQRARFVRLRVPRVTALHLRRVQVLT